MRLLWMSFFVNPGHYKAVNGQIDLREWDAASSPPITLDGDWEFYPHTWLMDGGDLKLAPEQGRTLLPVPGGWNTAMPESGSSFGYGSYRLRILTNPDRQDTFALYVSSVRSSSELYVNGRLLAQSGRPAASEEEALPRNFPYSASFTSDSKGIIDLVLQASNFTDSRNSGIIRSVKLGTEQTVQREAQLSNAMQQMIGMALLIHAVYALIVFAIGKRDSRLIFFALLTFSSIFAIAGNGDKVLESWLSLPYVWSFKLKGIAMLIGAYSLLQCLRHQLPAFLRDRGFALYSAVIAACLLLTLLMPLAIIMNIRLLFTLMVGFSLVVAMGVMIRFTLQRVENHFFWLLAIIAFAHSMLWEFILTGTGTKALFYPFDLMVAMIAFASVWFKNYFRVFAETEKLAGKLQRADKLKDTFLANTSHELRNPLHGILNISQAVLEREQASLKDRTIRDLEMVLTIGRRMSFMLNDLLDMMRLKESGIQLQTASHSLKRIASGVIASLEFMTESKPVQLNNHIPSGFPLVLADENRLIQILFNLLHNAVKFTNRGEVTIRAEIDDGRARIFITDTGIGMDEETLQRVFEPYEQAYPGGETASGGFGLGLGICKQLIELHGGTLEGQSAPGQGSEFRFSLPLAPASSCSQADETEEALVTGATQAAASTDIGTVPAPAPRPVPEADTIRILAVDDDPVNLNVLSHVFSVEPLYEIVRAGSAKEALSLLEAGEWDLVITDVMMPYMSGLELTQRIRERFKVYELPILLLTARVRPEDIEAGFLSGANDYVTKPVNAIELRTRSKALTGFKRSVEDRLSLEAAWHQAQIKPHFIFNTFNAVVALSKFDMDRTRALVGQFSSYLRASFDFHNSDRVIPLEQELHMVRSYLSIEKERFGERLTVMWEMDEAIDLNIPPLSIQPLVENAVIHGALKRIEHGSLHIRIIDEGQAVRISVADNGPGMNEEKLQRILSGRPDKSLGIGLRNTNLRLKQLYGKGLRIDSKPAQGTRVSFSVPKENRTRKQ
ncbi:ATP-binding protein [Paenibacillus sp. y28]